MDVSSLIANFHTSSYYYSFNWGNAVNSLFHKQIYYKIIYIILPIRFHVLKMITTFPGVWWWVSLKHFVAWDRELAQSLKTITALAEDTDSVLSIHTVAPTNLTRVPLSSPFYSDQILRGAHKRTQASKHSHEK